MNIRLIFGFIICVIIIVIFIKIKSDDQKKEIVLPVEQTITPPPLTSIQKFTLKYANKLVRCNGTGSVYKIINNRKHFVDYVTYSVLGNPNVDEVDCAMLAEVDNGIPFMEMDVPLNYYEGRTVRCQLTGDFYYIIDGKKKLINGRNFPDEMDEKMRNLKDPKLILHNLEILNIPCSVLSTISDWKPPSESITFINNTYDNIKILSLSGRNIDPFILAPKTTIVKSNLIVLSEIITMTATTDTHKKIMHLNALVTQSVPAQLTITFNWGANSSENNIKMLLNNDVTACTGYPWDDMQNNCYSVNRGFTGLFDSHIYEKIYPQYTKGGYTSGWDHYSKYGFKSNFNIVLNSTSFGQWDDVAYLQNNPDVAEAYKDPSTWSHGLPGLSHYILYGYAENRKAFIMQSIQ